MSKIFLSKKRASHIPLEIIGTDSFDSWVKKQSKALANKAKNSGFEGKAGQLVILRDENDKPERIYCGCGAGKTLYDFAPITAAIEKAFTKTQLEQLSFEYTGLKAAQAEPALIGWGLQCYHFSAYKQSAPVKPALIWPAKADKTRISAFIEAIHLTRTLINIPANDMGPDELEAAAKSLAKSHEAKVSVIKDEALLDKNFPLIYAVGKASPRRPRLIDLKWGDVKHPKITLVGKGVCFDTGGLDLKPSKSMLQMKKDMGGAAHVLGMAALVMALKLPIRLRVLIPAVENSVAGNAFRPWDILPSRKGITVEVGNTDAEGRLVLADALTLACEEKPDLLIDCATLTGAQRIAMGFDIGSVFSNDDKIAEEIKTLSLKHEDPLWPLPLWKPYRGELDSANADISSTGGMAGCITAALFLQEFITPETPWIHTDIAAWESIGRPGRAKGGMDMGVRALFAYLEKRYA